MYTVSLSIQPSFELNIHHQSLNVDLISPTYITSNKLKCHRPPDYKVCAGNTMRSGFIIWSRNASYGALIYKLQKKQAHESVDMSKDTSNNTHLLVVWNFSEELYANVLLVKYDKTFDKDDLKGLYHKNINRFKLHSDSAKEIWLSDDNIALMTTFEIKNEDRTLNVTISEVEKDNDIRMPAHIDHER
jgi:hypothetical protein